MRKVSPQVRPPITIEHPSLIVSMSLGYDSIRFYECRMRTPETSALSEAVYRLTDCKRSH